MNIESLKTTFERFVEDSRVNYPGLAQEFQYRWVMNNDERRLDTTITGQINGVPEEWFVQASNFLMSVYMNIVAVPFSNPDDGTFQIFMYEDNLMDPDLF